MHVVQPSGSADKDILFFDGHCTLCNGTVDFIIRRNKTLSFAAMQGETAAALLPASYRDRIETVVLRDKTGALHTKADAFARVCAQMEPAWLYRAVSVVINCVPRMVKNAVYDLVASNRYTLFKKKDTCRKPSPEERGRLLP